MLAQPLAALPPYGCGHSACRSERSDVAIRSPNDAPLQAPSLLRPEFAARCGHRALRKVENWAQQLSFLRRAGCPQPAALASSILLQTISQHALRRGDGRSMTAPTALDGTRRKIRGAFHEVSCSFSEKVQKSWTFSKNLLYFFRAPWYHDTADGLVSAHAPRAQSRETAPFAGGFGRPAHFRRPDLAEGEISERWKQP